MTVNPKGEPKHNSITNYIIQNDNETELFYKPVVRSWATDAVRLTSGGYLT